MKVLGTFRNILGAFRNFLGAFGSLPKFRKKVVQCRLDPYTFLDVGQELNAWNNLQRVQNSAFPPNRTKEFNIDTSNKSYPSLTPLYYNGAASNNALLNNPPDHNQNSDMTSQKTYIKPFYSINEQFGSVLPIEINNSILPLGPIYI